MSDISVNVSGGTNVVVAVGGTLANTPLTALQVTAGANITITTSSGVYTFIGPNVPVQSVNGQTGHIVVSGGTGSIASVNGKTGTVVLTHVDVSAASASHTHAASSITNLTSVANVVSVNGITGTPSIVGGAGVTVSTSGSSITIEAGGSTASGAQLSNALPQGMGTPSAGTSGLASRSDHVHAMPSATQVGAASAVHTHVASDITNLTSVANVVSVNGKTGAVSLVASDITAAAAAHGHDYVTKLNGQTGAISVVAGGNVTVSTSAGSITIAAPAPGDAFPPQSGNATRVLTTDGTAASWGTRYNVVEPVMVAGSGVTLTKNSGAGQVVIAMDVTLLGEAPVTPGFHVQSSGIYLTAVQYGYQYTLERFDTSLQQYVVAGSVVSSSSPPSIIHMNFGYNSGFDYRWRALSSNSVPSPWGYSDGAPGGPGGTAGNASGGGIAMSYLFA